MGTHSNYLTVDGDFVTAMTIAIASIIIFAIIVIALKIWEHYENKQAEKVAYEEWLKEKEEEDKIKTEMNFFENRIAEDMLKIGSQINTNLVNLYRD